MKLAKNAVIPVAFMFLFVEPTTLLFVSTLNSLKKNELDSRIQLMRSAVEKMEKAVEFWKWCETTLLLVSSPSTEEEEEEERREGEAAKEQADDQSDKKSPESPDVDQVSLTSQRKIVEKKKAMELMEEVERMIEDVGLILRTPP